MAVTREQVIATIMKRDNLDYETARDLVNETGWQIADAIDIGLGDAGAIEVLKDFLNLDKEYLYAFL